MAVIIKSKREIDLMKKSGEVMIGLHKALHEATRPGISTAELDKIAGRYCKEHGAIPSSKGYEGYPGNICISVNDTLVHGIPSKKIVLKEGDIVTYDCLVTLNGYTTDAARTWPVGKVTDEAKKLIETTEKCFFEAVKLVKPGVHLGDISHTIQEVAEKEGYSLTDMFTGHGVGREVHEDPYIPNQGKAGVGLILQEGMTLTIEPMVNLGTKYIEIMEDGWTAKTKDGKICSHYENTVVVTKDGYEIITLEKGEE